MRESLKKELLDHHFEVAKPSRLSPSERFTTNNTKEYATKKAESRIHENMANNEMINRQHWNLSPA
jgi:hypothetical protein